MRKFEYLTFDLADYNEFPALRYQRILFDISHTVDMPDFAFLEELKAEMETEYDAEALTPTEEQELDFWVRKTAKQMAIDMLVLGKTQPANMERAVALPDEQFDRCIALCNEMASTLNIRVKENEARSKAQNHTVDTNVL